MSMTAVDVFIPTGLLDDDETDVLAWDGEKKAPFGIPPVGGESADGRRNAISMSTLQSNGLLDEEPEEEDVGRMGPVSRGDAANGAIRGLPALLIDETGVPDIADSTQDDLPSLRQLLRANKDDSQKERLNPIRATHDSVADLLTSLSPIPAVTFEGRTINLRKRRKQTSYTTFDRQQASGLLEIPLHRLKDRLSEITAADLSLNDAGPSNIASSSSSSTDTELWVDRYRPARFTDLLGDERVHRETMTWLKEWDYCVYGKRSALSKSKRNDEADVSYQDRYEDAFKRPREKILLLSGAAGFGKTTLAHVAARQAGYDVMEINASDARSGSVIDDRIRPTLEAGSKMGSAKPVCLVIDEIDGATGGGDNSAQFVQKLISLTFTKAAKKGKNSKEKSVARPLLRPIICICNDLYASALTQLRQHARIIRFTRPSDTHLTKRLRTICEDEGLRAESRALSALVGVTKGDMRSCLNTLQFIKAKNQEVTEPIIRKATVGMKEGDDSVLSALSSLFAPVARKRVKELGLTETEESRYVGRLSSEIEASGATERVALGCFEHYTKLRHFEASLARHAKGIKWLSTFDSLSGAMRSDREYGLMPYLPYALVPLFPLFNERGGTKVERPKADWEAYTNMKAHEEIFTSLVKCAQDSASKNSADLRHVLSNEIMQLELAPYLNRIICPPMQPVNRQITKPNERALLARLVDIMTTFGLAYIRDKSEDGQLLFRLEPPIDALIQYEGKRPSDIHVQRYGTKSLICQELDERYAARDLEVVEKSKKKTHGMFQRHADGESAEGLLGKRKADAMDIADKPPVDFFGRPIAQAAPISKKSKGERSVSGSHHPTQKEFKVSFKFNEGNSAAVRRPVKVSSFI